MLKPIDKTRQKGGAIPAPAGKPNPKFKWQRKKAEKPAHAGFSFLRV